MSRISTTQGVFMRFAIAVLIALVTIARPAASEPEKRTFIFASNADGYGVDRCLATGARCGAAVARAYCRSRDYQHAVAFRRAEQREVARTEPSCSGKSCEQYVAIECTR
jgi:hypothetical protein